MRWAAYNKRHCMGFAVADLFDSWDNHKKLYRFHIKDIKNNGNEKNIIFAIQKKINDN